MRAFLTLSLALAFAQAPPTGASFLLRGGTVHTISGPVIENGSVLVRDGRIIGVGKNLAAPEGMRVIDIPGQQVYPGMIDSAALNPDPEQIAAARANGVTTMLDPPAARLDFPAITTLPIPPHEPEDDAEAEPKRIPYAQAKRLYDKQIQSLNKFFSEARRNPKAEKYAAFQPVLDGASPLLVTAVREGTIREAIAFADKQKIRIILADAYEAYKVLPLIQSHNIPVVLGPTLSLPLDPDDPYDRSFTTPGDLFRAGIQFSIGTFSSRRVRNLPYQAAAAVPFGLPQDQAYRAVSLSAAEIFGLAKRLGSIDEGKTANLIVTDGDPLEATTHVNLVFIDGKSVSLETRQKQLYEKYLGKQSSNRPRKTTLATVK